MPFHGFQGIVNGWVKVNTKNVEVKNITVRRESHDDNQFHSANSGSVHVSTSIVKKEPEVRTTRRGINLHKQRSKLERSVSLTDLLREMAKEKESEIKLAKEAAATNAAAVSNSSSSSSCSKPSESRTAIAHTQQQAQFDGDEDDSFRFVAGFFGDIPPPPPPPAAVRKDEQPRVVHPRLYYPADRPYDGRPFVLTGGSLDGRPLVTAGGESLEGEDSCSAPPPGSIRGTPPLHPSRIHQSSNSNASSSNPMQQFFMNFPHPGGAGKRCASCEELESRLLALHSDMEYLRSVALANELSVRENVENPDELKHEAFDVSARITELESKHLEQMEQLAKERARWQQNMHFKLSKFATIAKDLNEESALRKQESMKLEDELAGVKAERDILALEVEQLRATVAQHNMEQEEYMSLAMAVQSYESEGLKHAKETNDQNLNIIRELTSRLERTMDALERERSKQRQQNRRQIIFPPRMSHPIPMQIPESRSSSDVAIMQEELRLAKAEARMAHDQLAHAKAVAARMESKYRLRTEELERQLANAYGSKHPY